MDVLVCAQQEAAGAAEGVENVRVLREGAAEVDEAMRRQAMYKSEEGRAILKEEEGDTHHHGGCGCGGDK